VSVGSALRGDWFPDLIRNMIFRNEWILSDACDEA
jgi:hypothetical protein